MHNLLTAYLLSFVVTFWPHLGRYQQREAVAIAEEVANTQGDVLEDLTLMNIAAMESGFSRSAVGKAGERGPWQVSTDEGRNHDFSAKEALRRMRTQGMLGYVGCRHAQDEVVLAGVRLTCAEVVAHRVDRAALFRMGFDPSREQAPGTLVATNQP
jgi:hypothetical protein